MDQASQNVDRILSQLLPVVEEEEEDFGGGFTVNDGAALAPRPLSQVQVVCLVWSVLCELFYTALV